MFLLVEDALEALEPGFGGAELPEAGVNKWPKSGSCRFAGVDDEVSASVDGSCSRGGDVPGGGGVD